WCSMSLSAVVQNIAGNADVGMHPQPQLTAFMRFAVSTHHAWSEAMPLKRAGRARSKIRPCTEPHAFHAILVREARHTRKQRVFEDGDEGALEENAARVSLGVLQDFA